MELDELLSKTAVLFEAFEASKTQVGCSLVIENVPYVFTWNGETKSFDKDEFPET
jgi:hypothetical protein